ncbi:hypothetical protein AAES_165347 [Amazona aestiva]|uniref:Uncharacterized protein n=1 Tax=Amazona aestiva TaxID=12930 RepID=A0A0Q3NZE0_AMAAE|nr:hypothetical protein AAES_165347 [Amazona aestiva]
MLHITRDPQAQNHQAAVTGGIPWLCTTAKKQEQQTQWADAGARPFPLAASGPGSLRTAQKTLPGQPHTSSTSWEEPPQLGCTQAVPVLPSTCEPQPQRYKTAAISIIPWLQSTAKRQRLKIHWARAGARPLPLAASGPNSQHAAQKTSGEKPHAIATCKEVHTVTGCVGAIPALSSTFEQLFQH